MMSKDPFLMMSVTDWLADTALRSCSPAARDLFRELVCHMHQTQIYGVMKVGADPEGKWKYSPRNSAEKDANFMAQCHENAMKTPRKRHENAMKMPRKRHEKTRGAVAQISRLVGIDAHTVERRVNQLYQAGVLSLTADGYLTYLRMIEDRQIRENWKAQKARQRAHNSAEKDANVHPNVHPDVHPPSSSSSIDKKDCAGSSISTGDSSAPGFFVSEKQKPAARNRAGVQVGRETGNGEESNAEKFKRSYFEAGLPPNELLDALLACGRLAEVEDKEAHEIFTACKGNWKNLSIK